jgi:sulfide dehydrogenase cytochrome subunit
MKGINFTHALLVGGMLFGLAAASGVNAADLNKLVEGCASCHGKDGATNETDMPNIGGLSAKYIGMTMKHYKNKERPCVETKVRFGDKKGTKGDMCQVVNDLNDDNVNQLAEYYAGKNFVRATQKFDAALAAKGKAIHGRSCEKCHSEGGTVASDDVGILAGQKTAYLEEQTDFYLAGKRWMHKKMKPKIEALNKAEIEALLQYYASFQ